MNLKARMKNKIIFFPKNMFHSIELPICMRVTDTEEACNLVEIRVYVEN